MSAGKKKKIHRKLGRQVRGAALLITPRNYSVLLPLTVSPLPGRDTSRCQRFLVFFFQQGPWCPGKPACQTEWGGGASPRLSRFISSLKGRLSRLRYWLTAPIMPFLWPPNQLFPVSPHYLVVFISRMKGLNTTPVDGRAALITSLLGERGEACDMTPVT